jgi:membrane-bound serine protease (ClpP class)
LGKFEVVKEPNGKIMSLKKCFFSGLFIFLISFISFHVFCEPSHLPNEGKCVSQATIDGIIGPATLDFLERSQKYALSNDCGSILLLINTPGGNLQTTRKIVEEILGSPVPVLCLIYPEGAHAGSAGAIIMQACHIAGALPTTNIGAATPISGSGEALPEDLRKKILNDTRSWVEGLAKFRGRNPTFAKDIVEQAKAVSAAEALDIHAIEIVAKTKEEFLRLAQGREVELSKNSKTIVAVGEVKVLEQDLRYKVMDILMNPQVAYLMLMISLGLLYFELTHPGMVAPGVIGGMGLLISLMSMEMLNVTWGAVLLILTGIGFMVGEAFVTGFGVLGIGGVVSFFIGSLFLFDPEQTGYVLPLSLIIPTSLFVGLLMIGIAYLAFTSRKRKSGGGFNDLVGLTAIVSEVNEDDARQGLVDIRGEIWRVRSEQNLKIGESVQIQNNKGLTLIVSRRS